MNHLKKLNKYLLQYKWHLLLGLIFIVISDFFGVWAQTYIGNAIDVLKSNENLKANESTYAIENTQSVLLNFALLFVGFNLIKGFFLFCQRQTIIVMSRRIEFDLKNDIYAKYQSLPNSFYQANNTGDILNRISEDVGKVRMYLGPAIMYTINLFVLVIITVGQMIKMSPELTFYVLTPLPVMGILIFLISKNINKKSILVQEQQSKLSTRAQEDFSAIRLIKTYGREKYANKTFEKEADIYRVKSFNLAKTDSQFMPIMILFVGLSTIITIVSGSYFLNSGEITIGDIGVFVLYVNMLTWPFAMVGWISSLVQRAAASQQRINEFMLNKEEKSFCGNKIFDENFESITFSNVSFSYNQNNETLSDINFTINKGESIGIIGLTGSGKSTIVSLLTAIQTGYKGSIMIGKNELCEIDIHSLRGNISVVPQEAYLFSQTISQNIAFGNKSHQPNSKIEYYAKQADVHNNIIDFEKKYETIVGERGITLSGGQKQRLTIARALIRQPNILIFDDCMSAVDAETEKTILQNLLLEMKGKTTFLVSHRTATVKAADKIIVLKKGKICETGTHEQLIHEKGLYAKLHLRQMSMQNHEGQ